MGFFRIIAIALSVLGFAVSANAGTQLYSGEMIIHMRGSDAAGDFVGIPFGRHCNIQPYHAEEIRIFTSASGATTGSLTVPKFGGQVKVIDTNSDSSPDVASGCAPASRQAGLPLTGGGALVTTGAASTARTAANPRAFTVPMSDLSRVTSGASFLRTTAVPVAHTTHNFNFEIEYADLRNGSGAFSAAGGPGSFTVLRSLSDIAKVRVKVGGNQFGGTMRLLGQYRTHRGLLSASTSVGATPWRLQHIGAGAQTMTGKVTAGLTYTTEIIRTYHYSKHFDYSPRYVTASVFPWTTGMVEVTALSGIQETVLKRTGYDNRTANGAGTIQLVSPALTRWKNPLQGGDYHTGSIGVIKLTFVPEPGAGLMLVAGISGLGLLYRVNGQRGRAY
jgi:hypothetical protein